MSLIVVASLTGCNNTSGDAEKKVETATEDNVDKNLEGKWAQNYTLDQTQKLFK